MKINNKDIIQSYLLTTARYDFNIHEKRILVKLVEMCQSNINGQELNKDFKINPTLFGDYIITMPTSAFLKDDDDDNHTRVKDALRRLRNKTIEYEDEKMWKLIGIIEKPKFDKQGFVTFELQPEIHQAILSFAKGWRKFELNIAMAFNSVYAMRFYELFSGQTTPLTYSIENLKIMFKIEDRYKDNQANFIRRVIDPAKKELDEKAPYSFNYKCVKTGPKITALTFYPVAIPKNRDHNLENRQLEEHVSMRWSLDKIIIDYLMQNYYFSETEIKNNMPLLKEANANLDLLQVLSEKRTAAEKKANPKGWIIAVLRAKLKELNTQTTLSL